MRKWCVLTIVALLAAPRLASAQDGDVLSRRGMLFPGTLSVSAGTIAPTEPGNVIGSAVIEQGFTMWNRGPVFVSGFVDVTKRYDSDGLAWNRATAALGGIKFVAVSRRMGILQIAGGVNSYAAPGGRRRESLAAYAAYWTGWTGQASSHSALLPKSYPGHAYASTGRVTAAEPGNWISQASVQQGVTITRPLGIAAIPFVGASINADSARYGWNNRSQAEVGFKLARSFAPGAVIEGGVANRYERNRLAHTARNGAVVFVDIWMGWSPRVQAR
jgi:hypothetical protein